MTKFKIPEMQKNTTAEAVEAKQTKIGNPGSSALAVHAEGQDCDPVANLTARFDELMAAIGWKRRKPYDKTKAHYYNCAKLGHFQHQCQEPTEGTITVPRDKDPEDHRDPKMR